MGKGVKQLNHYFTEYIKIQGVNKYYLYTIYPLQYYKTDEYQIKKIFPRFIRTK